MKAVDFMVPMLGTLRQVGLEGETAGTAIAGMFKGIMSFDENVKKTEGCADFPSGKRLHDRRGL